jgi:hypothetical protein
MSGHMKSSWIPSLALAGALLAATPSLAAAPPDGGAPTPAPPPRTVDAILADAIAATGGDAPWKAHHSMQVKTAIEYRKMAMSATRTQISTSKNKSLAVTTIPNVGVVNEGTNGKVAWSQDPINGLRILSGAEAAQSRIESTWNLDRHLKQVFQSIEPTVEKDDKDGGRALECLTMTPKSGRPMTTCYDPVTHLQVLQRGVAATPQGDVPFSSRTKEWKEIGGMKIPALVEMSTGPIEFTARVTEVTFDQPVDEKIFDVPSKQKAKAGAKAETKTETGPKPKDESKAKPPGGGAPN